MGRSKRKRLQREMGKRLIEYIRTFKIGLTENLAHWASYGIFTPEQLGDYLDSVSAADHAEYLRDPD